MELSSINYWYCLVFLNARSLIILTIVILRKLKATAAQLVSVQVLLSFAGANSMDIAWSGDISRFNIQPII